VYAPLNRDVDVRNVVQHGLNESLVALLAEELNERLRLERLPASERSEPVLGEPVVEVSNHY
jgi:hypothetical protein